MSAKLSPQRSPSAFRRCITKRSAQLTLIRAGMMAAALAGCSGDISQGGTEGEEVRPREDVTSMGACGQPRSVGAGQWRRLTSSQYVNTVRDLLGQTPNVSALLADSRTAAFATNVQPIAPEDVDAYHAMAKVISQKAVADMSRLAPCEAANQDQCAADFIKSFGARAFRRPLLPAEEEAFQSVYTSGKKLGYAAGIRLVVEAALSSPSFLYLVESGTPAAGGLRKLTGFEVASRLSYTLTGSSPDPKLLNAAKIGDLDSVEGIRKYAKELVQSEKFVEIARQFHIQLTDVDSIDKVSRTAQPEFDPAMRSAMMEEVGKYVEYVMSKGGGSVEELFAGSYVFPSGPLSKIYGQLKTDEDGRAEIKDGTRKGILTLAGVQAVHPNTFSPRMAINRGYMVRRDFLCQTLPPVMGNVNFALPPNADQLSAQELLRRHQENDSCKGCHRLMDPIGFGFEIYDSIGKHRSKDGAGNAIVSSGEIVDLDSGDGIFANTGEMSDILAKSPEVRACMSTQWMRFALARDPDEEADRCSLTAVATALSNAKGNIQEAVLSLVSSDAFRFIRGE